MKRGIFVAPFDELHDPRLLAELAAEAERCGWDGFFLWDHIAYDPPVRAVADPWVALAAIACATERVLLGPLVTPLARRRAHKLARETTTLQQLSGGRLVLGVGLGGDRGGELSRFGEELDPRRRAALLDDGLAQLRRLWDGELEPRPAPRIPVWVAARHPNRRPLRRAVRHDGLFPIEVPDPAALAAYLEGLDRPDGFDVVVTHRPRTDLAPWAAAGATWGLTGWDAQPREDDVRAAIAAGPGAADMP